MSYEFKYFNTQPHHKVFTKFYQRHLPGKEICVERGLLDQAATLELIAAEDAPNVVWMFPELHKGLHERLVGRQVFIAHGGGFKPWHVPWRVKTINQHIDLYLSSGPPDERKSLAAGVSPSVIRRMGYPLLFEIPPLAVQPNALLISSVYWQDWNQYDTIVGIIERLAPEIQGYVTFHPDTPVEKKERLLSACRQRANITVLATTEELLEAYAYCRWLVASNSSVTLPFWHQKKSVILARGQIGDAAGGSGEIGWQRIVEATHDELFVRIIRESTKVDQATEFTSEFLESAKISDSAVEAFYPTNSDEQATIRILHCCMDELR